MKIGVSATTYKPPFSPILFKDRPSIRALLQAVRASGVDCVDLFVNELSEAQQEETGQALRDTGLSLSLLLSFVPATLDQNLTHRDLTKRRECIDFYIRQMNRTHKLGGKLVCIGLARGNRGEGRTQEEYERILKETLLRLMETSSKLGLWMILEPCNRYEIDNFHTVDSCLEFIDKTKLDMGLLPDLFHMNIEETDIAAALRRAGKTIGHMHVADTHRLAPGTAHMDYRSVIQALKDVGYNGALTMECPPIPDEQTCVTRGMSYLSELMKEMGVRA
jgi:sugar phosphate isomerase/epimerase